MHGCGLKVIPSSCVLPRPKIRETYLDLTQQLGVFGCGTARTGSSPDVLSRPSNFEGQQSTGDNTG
jgi:hypothetical protein